MAIYDPQTFESEATTTLVELLKRILAEDEFCASHNLEPSRAVLSPSEKEKLRELAELFGDSPDFRRVAYFVSGLTSQSPDLDRLREVYLSQRAKRGRTRVASTSQWANFVTRFGLIDSWDRYFGIGATQRMEHPYFLSMEDRLLTLRQFPPSVRRKILAQIAETEPEVEGVRRGERPISETDLIRVPNIIAEDAKEGAVDRGKLSAFATVVVDAGVLFTTRDWSVAGGLSTLSGALAVLAIK